MLSVVVLAVPTIAMGGTLPAAARAVTRERRRPPPGSGHALRASTRSAPSPAACLSTFFLLELYGTRETLWLAAAINILVAVAARAMERRAVDRREADEAAALERGARERAGDAGAARDRSAGERSARRTARLSAARVGRGRLRLLPDGAGLVPDARRRCSAARCSPSAWCSPSRWPGSASADCSIRWSPSDRPRDALRLRATSCLLEALAVAATFALGDRMALLALALAAARRRRVRRRDRRLDARRRRSSCCRRRSSPATSFRC